MQKKLIPRFHCSLEPGGVLFPSSAETFGAFSRLFALLAKEARRAGPGADSRPQPRSTIRRWPKMRASRCGPWP
jgi:hypothetical protein